MLSHTSEIRVRYADTDQMHCVYNGKYLEYFEVGRAEMMRNYGLDYKTVESKGYFLPLTETYIKYLNPAYYDDIILVKAFVKEFPLLKIHIDYSLSRKENKEIVAEGFTEHVFLSKNSNKVVRPPVFFVDAIKSFYDKK
jgi:acyl-CoA thioester hydrolase